MNDKLAEFVLSNGYQYQLSLDSKKLLIPYLLKDLLFVWDIIGMNAISLEGYVSLGEKIIKTYLIGCNLMDLYLFP